MNYAQQYAQQNGAGGQTQAPAPAPASASPYTGPLGTNPNDSVYGNLIDNSITRGIQSIFPGQQVGKALGTIVGSGVADAQGTGQYYDKSIPSAGQLIGDVAQGALTVAMPGAGEGAGLVGRLGAQAALGAGFGLTGSLAAGNTDLGQLAGDTGKGALIGGALGAGGELLGAGINKLAQPFAKDLQPEVIKSAEKIGMSSADLPTSAITNNKTIKYMESLFNGDKLAQQVDSAQMKLSSITDAALASTGPVEDLTTVGQKLAKGLNDFQTAYKTTINKLYDDFSKQGGSLPVTGANAIDTLNNIIDRKTAIGETGDLKYFKDKLDILTGESTSKIPTFDIVKQIRTAVGEKIGSKFQDPFVAQHIGQLKQFYGALSKDMETTITSVGNPKLTESFNRANAAYTQGKTILNTEYAKTISTLAKNGQFDRIVPALTSSTKSIANIPALLQIIGPENVPSLQTAILNDIFTKAQGDLGFTEKGIAKMINKYGEDKLNALLTPQQMSFLGDLDKVSRALAQAEKISKGSQTAFLGKSLANVMLGAGAVKEFLSGNFLAAVTNLTPILGEKAASTFLNSDLGRKIMTTGFKLNPGLVPGIRQVTKVATMQSAK